MKHSSVQRLQDLFALALELPATEHANFLQRECADDVGLQSQLLKLLAVDASLQGSTARPAIAGFRQLVSSISPIGSLQGVLIGHYRVCEPLGQGGMGSVYRAERIDGTLTQQVAVKFVRRELLDANTLRRFQLERQTLAALDHPSIARLIDAAELPDGTPYFLMEYVAGVAITEYCSKNALDLHARLRLFREVCAAVSHAHRNLVVHRDLKPGNILVNALGVPKLLDFGIAKNLGISATSSSAELTGTAQRFFSPRYAAPEQLLGQVITVGCDVYALGLLLYELLCGLPPYDLEGLSAGQIEHLITSVPPPAPSTRALRCSVIAFDVRQLRGDLDDLVLRCLRKSPVERYASVERLEDEVARYLDGRPLSIRGGQWFYRLRKFSRRQRVPLAIAGLASLALTLAALTLVRQNEALRSERDLSQQSLLILKDAFASADPIRAAGADLSAHQILEAARRRIDEIYEQHPDLYARLAETIAEVDLSVGRAKEAASLMERVVQADASGQDSGTDRQRRLILLARALTNADRSEEAGQRLVQARALSTVAPAEWNVAKGRLLALSDDPRAALPLLEEANVSLANALPSNALANLARLTLAEALRRVGDNTASLAVLDETLRWQRSTLPESHPQITDTRMRRIVLIRDAGRLPEALKEARAVSEEVERIYGAHSPDSAFAQTTLGRILNIMDRPEEAIKAYRRALDAWQQSLGADHPNSVRAAFNLAGSLQHHADTVAEAEVLYRHLLDSATSRAGRNDELVVYYRLHFGRFLQRTNRPLEAIKLLAVPDGWNGLESSSVDNRGLYLRTLETLAETLECPSWNPGIARANAASPQTHCSITGEWLEREKHGDNTVPGVVGGS